MDAGLAGLLGGVLGAAVGSLGATASAYISGRKAEQQARVQAEAQLTQVRLQLHSEQLQQRREPRVQAYAALLALATDMLRMANDSMAAIEIGDFATPEALAGSALSRIEDLEPLLTRVLLEGPESMVAPASQLRDALHFAWPVEEFPTDMGQLGEFRDQAEEAIKVFLSSARSALDLAAPEGQ
ncbi:MULTISPECIES: hypothetical protein [Streptomyces]|uniref:hypothetical protein n=1 Tax=Streptomyces TaxID=1883 RepID=UPI000F116B5D|nr:MULTISPECIES: hypothetical protein [Streptomyces]MCX4433945.1 hypothetical protein [Streptomyces mirabilis]QDO08667.1 hypothetical protein FNV68_22515 [Streptomyces sp. S1D4-23]